jgi:hypothetical protein
VPPGGKQNCNPGGHASCCGAGVRRCDGFRTTARSLSSQHALRPVGRRSKPANERNRDGGHPYRRALWGFGLRSPCSGDPARQVAVPIVGDASAMGISPLSVGPARLASAASVGSREGPRERSRSNLKGLSGVCTDGIGEWWQGYGIGGEEDVSTATRLDDQDAPAAKAKSRQER